MYRLVSFTGAGISKASGIPTFEEMGDIRDKLSIDYFTENPESFYNILLKMKKLINTVEPNAAHYALAEYDIPVVTMNIDGLHQKAGSKCVVEVHGNLEYVSCICGGKKLPFETVEDSVYCDLCKQPLCPSVVLYGGKIACYRDADTLVRNTKELLVVGTSFYTSTSSIFVASAKQAGAKITIINDNAETKVLRYLQEVFINR